MPDILVVEDNPDNMTLVKWILEDEGHNTIEAPTGEDCLALLKTKTFDLILMDISLPGIDGKETTRLIRQNSLFKELPIIALTAHAVKGEEEAIWKSGVSDLITKPIAEELLIQRIEFFLNNKDQPPEN